MSESTRNSQPIILIRGFGQLDVSDEKQDAYQGFNNSTVYPHKKGENYIYEGFILRFLKSDWKYQDATNVVGYYGKVINNEPVLPRKLLNLEDLVRRGVPLSPQLQRLEDKNVVQNFKHLQSENYFSGDKVIIDPAMALHLLESVDNVCQTIWVFRYYDLNDRTFTTYGKALVRLINFIRELAHMQNPDKPKPKVNIIAHSMGGLLVREAIQRTYPENNQKGEDFINKIVTIGTPHQGISFQLMENWIGISAKDEIEHFNPNFQKDAEKPESFVNFHKYFPLERMLAIVGTNYRTYDIRAASFANRLFSIEDEYGTNYNRSDGLVKQSYAQIPGALRTFIHKSHSGKDSIVTSREAFEIATRFFFGNLRARLRFVRGKVTRGKDLFGKSEFFLGVSIKPRGVDFELFHQSKEAENCYGPFSKTNTEYSDNNIDFGETNDELGFSWADDNKLIWEGYFDTKSILQDESIAEKDMVMRLDFYVGERDLLGIGFSDNVIFRKQYYIRALLPTQSQELQLFLHRDEQFADKNNATVMEFIDGGWEFEVRGTGFVGTFKIEIDIVPEEGEPQQFLME
ncbi:PGAP1-like protein [Rivularia sp. PCC 7116]|uniref:esterase/lipase family protein n=1 Tax=Rivularia sp. PCC 7116 TaxID=373994 RepID=UPI00029F209C|nr:alpha/beta hydrolase [Rivularia sp. PCC 7116]AFY53499.1 PGAP1-like protein [Rivularia sp. PCC 7116]